ncbi:hypothetical protein [Pyxidicoccus xibeiensis]|uniref:hypothetical protein n=1 Tax=Pyxidicoccus xibeiensis TaxID=2906759 RepID=UPI0020A6E303|nr:hypothetical protein [Pyxidicoccus xibeiensis]MCP3143245.1 hypothetical protein [Pyxidicoccus xibeiensis]
MRAAMWGGLLVAGLMAGCGGANVDEEGPSELETRSEAIPCRDITGRDYVITYYSDASKQTKVGELQCGCSTPERVLTGTQTSYYQKVYGCIAM